MLSYHNLYIEFLSSPANAHVSSIILLPLSKKTFVKTKKGQEAVKLSPLPKRAKRTYLAMDTDKEVIGYVIPVFRAK